MHLKDIKEGEATVLIASGKTRDEAAKNFKLKLFMFILHNFEIIDKIANKCEKIEKCRKYKLCFVCLVFFRQGFRELVD